jgi:hypothetical protein
LTTCIADEDWGAAFATNEGSLQPT